jgi:hypothetical protein
MPNRQQYIRNQEIIRRRMEKLFVPKVYAALQSQIAAAVAAVREKGIAAAQGNIHGSILNTEIGAVITELYSVAAKLAIRKYKPNKKAFGFNDDFVAAVLEYFKKFLLTKVVVPISQTTINQIEAVLQLAITNGWGVEKTVKELEDSPITKVRARLIVRTETVKATNFTQLAAADSEEIEMQKEWIAIEDKRTRKSHSHAGVDGERVDIDQPYSNGLMFPGDPNGNIKEIANCRCTQGFFAKRDENGRLIRKTTPPLDLLTRMKINQAA